MKFTSQHLKAFILCFAICIALGIITKVLFNENMFVPYIMGGLFVFIMQGAKQNNITKQ